MSFKKLSEDCATQGITVVKNKGCTFFYNGGNVADLKELHNKLVEHKKNTTIIKVIFIIHLPIQLTSIIL
jgi:RecB family endonuclease NucS